MSLLDRAVGYLGQRINGISMEIDIVGRCVLFCPTCAVGSIGGRRAAKMSIETFKKIMDKATSESKVRKVQLYVYTEAGMHPDLHLFVQDLTDRGIESTLSTMCQSTLCDWAKVVEARPTELRISFPGWEKMTKYQKGAKPELFDKNVEKLCSLPRHKETAWTMAWHLYNDNGDEYPRVRALAEKLNLKLVVLPAIFMVLEKTVRNQYSEADKEIISHLIETPEQAMSRMKKRTYCDLWKHICLNVHGEVMLCELIYEDEFKIGSFLDTPLSGLQKKIRNHSFCTDCISCGGNQYQACYADFHKSSDPVGEANRKRGYSLNLPQ